MLRQIKIVCDFADGAKGIGALVQRHTATQPRRLIQRRLIVFQRFGADNSSHVSPLRTGDER
ncbi:hypothetical protein RHECNPAF_54008 [Rhizobium etli CNPAF512]|nr:hypothetical protein RHECNPAF_54008 [Rhizobium etli CNPAF512]